MPNNQDYAVLAAVSRYPGWTARDLEGPVNDLRDFATWLLEPTGGHIPKESATALTAWLAQPVGPQMPPEGAPADKVQFFVSPSGIAATGMTVQSATPVTQFVENAFREFNRAGNSALKATGDPRIGRRLYVFLAGHGFAPSKYETALLMADASADEPGLHVVGRAYADHFVDTNIFDEVVLVMDCCREDNDVVPLRLPPFRRFVGPRVPTPAKPFCALGARWSQKSRELPFYDSAGQKEIRGVFTRVLLEGLRGARDNGVVTAASLERWVGERIRKVAQAAPEVEQRPEFDFDRTCGDTFVLCTPEPAAVNLRICVKGGDPLARVNVRFGPRNLANVPSTKQSGATWEYTLDPGLYEASIVGTGRKVVITEDMLGGPDVDL